MAHSKGQENRTSDAVTAMRIGITSANHARDAHRPTILRVFTVTLALGRVTFEEFPLGRRHFGHNIWCVGLLVRTHKSRSSDYLNLASLETHTERIVVHVLDEIRGVQARKCDVVAFLWEFD